ncbi:MAG: hypothetical protein IH940_00125 [Acidobacteria bacterium]|nr:hypothetical protein [Acidobacteriota bacterium]
MNDTMGEMFAAADFVITSTNPGPAFSAENPMSSDEKSFIDYAKGGRVTRLGFRAAMKTASMAAGVAPKLPNALVRLATSRAEHLLDMGALTIPANIAGNPAVSIPAGQVDGLPVGMQVIGRHHCDAVLFDVALAAERSRPWPLVVPNAPA